MVYESYVPMMASPMAFTNKQSQVYSFPQPRACNSSIHSATRQLWVSCQAPIFKHTPSTSNITKRRIHSQMRQKQPFALETNLLCNPSLLHISTYVQLQVFLPSSSPQPETSLP